MSGRTDADKRADWIERRGVIGITTLVAILLGFLIYGGDEAMMTAALESCQIGPTGEIRACAAR